METRHKTVENDTKRVKTKNEGKRIVEKTGLLENMNRINTVEELKRGKVVRRQNEKFTAKDLCQ